jgi:hypothetical protein
MRLNYLMTVVTVACVVAVISSVVLGPRGWHRVNVPDGHLWVEVSLTQDPLVTPPEDPPNLPPPHHHSPGLIIVAGSLPIFPPPAFDPPGHAETGLAIPTLTIADVQKDDDKPVPPPQHYDVQPVGGFVVPNTVSVPEPEIWALMILGIGGVGLALRRQRGRAKSAAESSLAA